MPSDFFYLLSSLPLLRRNETPPLSYDDFMRQCREQLAANDLLQIELAQLLPPADAQAVRAPLLRDWYAWETFVRNILAEARARRKRIESARFQRPTDYFQPSDRKRVEEIFALSGAEEREVALLQLRWEHLDELESGHYYDLGVLLVYALRLQLLQRQASQESEAGGKRCQELLEGLQQGAEDGRIQV